ncbi:MAG: hypothetical protein KJ722_00710, partial [Candidatus Omnitrophica bacterium]|nr:hypothetical protein [Candidatus Omnitrophota bacterium]
MTEIRDEKIGESGVRGKFSFFHLHIGNNKMKREEIKTQASNEANNGDTKQQGTPLPISYRLARVSPVDNKGTAPAFRSNFKSWIRVVAFIIVVVFLPEQAAQAVEYDWRVLWNRPALSTFAPTYLKDPRNLNIPITVKNILKDIAGKPVKSIKISPTLTVELEKPLKITSKRIEEIFNWLQGKPCGSKALYDFLSYQGIKVEEQDIAVLVLTVDILNDIIKPEGNPKVIKNSLYALSKAAEFFGLKLYPVKLTQGLSPSNLSGSALKETVPANITPFIAHLKGDHFILVTRISGEKIYFLDEHKEEFLPIGKFSEKFTGYILTSQENIGGLTRIKDSESRLITGSGRDREHTYSTAANWKQWEKQIGTSLLINVGINLVGAVLSNTKFSWKDGSTQTTTLPTSDLGFDDWNGDVFGQGKLSDSTITSVQYNGNMATVTSVQPTLSFGENMANNLGAMGTSFMSNVIPSIGTGVRRFMVMSAVQTYINGVAMEKEWTQNHAAIVGSFWGGIAYGLSESLLSAAGPSSTLNTGTINKYNLNNMGFSSMRSSAVSLSNLGSAYAPGIINGLGNAFVSGVSQAIAMKVYLSIYDKEDPMTRSYAQIAQLATGLFLTKVGTDTFSFTKSPSATGQTVNLPAISNPQSSPSFWSSPTGTTLIGGALGAGAGYLIGGKDNGLAYAGIGALAGGGVGYMVG